MCRTTQHANIGTRTKDILLGRGEDNRAHLRVFETKPLHGIVKLDIDAEVVGIELQLVTLFEAAVRVHIHGEGRDLTFCGEPPMAIAFGCGLKVDHDNFFRRSITCVALPVERSMLSGPLAST